MVDIYNFSIVSIPLWWTHQCTKILSYFEIIQKPDIHLVQSLSSSPNHYHSRAKDFLPCLTCNVTFLYYKYQNGRYIKNTWRKERCKFSPAEGELLHIRLGQEWVPNIEVCEASLGNFTLCHNRAVQHYYSGVNKKPFQNLDKQFQNFHFWIQNFTCDLQFWNIWNATDF